MSKLATLSPQDHLLVRRIGELTGITPGNSIRGLAPIRKGALSKVSGVRIRQSIYDQYKYAEAGPSTQQQFSESFAAMAFTFIEERSPSLREFMMGFQVVDRGKDSDSAFGVFGFQLPTRIVQCPVFFVKGQVKGYQVLFVPEQQLFMPSHEGFVQRLINNDSLSNGEPGPAWGDMSGMADPSAVGGQIPDAIKYASVLKRASYQKPLSWAEETGLYESIAGWFTDKRAYSQLSDLLKEKQYKSASCDLDETLSMGSPIFEKAAQLALAFPAVYRAIRAGQSDRMQKLAHAAIEADSRYVVKRGGIVPNGQRLVGKTASSDEPLVAVYTRPEPPRMLSKEAVGSYKNDIACFGMHVVDSRPDRLCSTLEKISIEVAQDFCSGVIDKPAKVTVIDNDNKSHSVIFIPNKLRYRKPDENLLLTYDNKSFEEITGNPVVVNTDEAAEDSDVLSSVGSTGLPTTKGCYLAISPNGQTFGPFCVREDSPKDSMVEIGRADAAFITESDDQNSIGSCDVYENDYKETCVVMPKDTKYVKFEESDTSDNDYYRFERKRRLRPEMVDTISIKKLVDVTVPMSKTAVGHYRIMNRPLTEKQAMLALVVGMGLRDKEAQTTLTSLEVGKPVRFIVKNAATRMLEKQNPDAVFPMLQGPTGASDNSRVPYIIDEPELESQPIEQQILNEMTPEQDGVEDLEEGYPTAPGNPGAMGGGMQMDPGLQDVVQSNIQGPMDVAVLASIISNSRVDGVITEAATKLMAGISELGKILLLLNAQRSAFEDLYPENDVKPLEDTLLTAFDSCGDAYLRIKQQMIMSDPATDAAVPFEHAM